MGFRRQRNVIVSSVWFGSHDGSFTHLEAQRRARRIIPNHVSLCGWCLSATLDCTVNVDVPGCTRKSTMNSCRHARNRFIEFWLLELFCFCDTQHDRQMVSQSARKI